jgi:[protein-PII] uridylyltransferase
MPELAGTAATPALAAGATLADCRTYLAAVREEMRQRYLAAAPIGELVHGLSNAVDQILSHAWRENSLPREGVALVAVGGYGRGELHPHSDIDIAILLGAPAGEELRRKLERFIAFLWDIGLDIGHSTRTLEECRREAAADITVATNLMEARLLDGDRDLYARMRELTGPASRPRATAVSTTPRKIWSPTSRRVPAACATSRSSAGWPNATSAPTPCTIWWITAS